MLLHFPILLHFLVLLHSPTLLLSSQFQNSFQEYAEENLIGYLHHFWVPAYCHTQLHTHNKTSGTHTDIIRCFDYSLNLSPTIISHSTNMLYEYIDKCSKDYMQCFSVKTQVATVFPCHEHVLHEYYKQDVKQQVTHDCCSHRQNLLQQW